MAQLFIGVKIKNWQSPSGNKQSKPKSLHKVYRPGLVDPAKSWWIQGQETSVREAMSSGHIVQERYCEKT